MVRIRESLNINLGRKEEHALVTFNREVRFNALYSPTIGHARISALRAMGKQPSIIDLAAAFRHLFPHWFTNGRGTLADGSAQDCAKACLDIVGKLNASSGQHFASITKLFDLSGNNAIATGRRPLAAIDDKPSMKRTRTRMRQIHCTYHPNRLSVAGELCSKCYSRWNTLSKKGIHLENYPGLLVEELMHHPRPSKKMPLYKLARELKRKYDKLEEYTDENQTATA